MFRTVIRSTQLTSDVADSFFQNIRGDGFQNDFSFLSTLRALVAPRMKDNDETINLLFKSNVYSSSAIGNVSVNSACKAISDYIISDENL